MLGFVGQQLPQFTAKGCILDPSTLIFAFPIITNVNKRVILSTFLFTGRKNEKNKTKQNKTKQNKKKQQNIKLNVFNNMRFSSRLKFPLTLRAVHVKQLQCMR